MGAIQITCKLMAKQLKEFTKSVELMSGKFDEKKHEEEQEKENTDTIFLIVFREN